MSAVNKSVLKNSVTNALFASLLFTAGIAQPAMAIVPPPSVTLPTGGAVVAGSGSATISKSGTTETISQSTNKAIINWSSFDVSSNGTVNFVQPSSSSVTLNRVTGGSSASQILGTVNANGILFLVNGNGIVFGKGSQVNVGGLVATTSDINNSDFNNGNYAFSPTANGHLAKSIKSDAQVINAGTITVNQDNGLVALVGHDVENSGIIQAKVQTTSGGVVTTIKTDRTGAVVELAAADGFSVDFNGDGLLNLAVTDPKAKKLLAENSGQITANGGTVLMTTATAEETVNSLINMTGIIQADNVSTKNGKVQLTNSGGDLNVSGTINAKKGSVTVNGNQTNLYGKSAINAAGGAVIVNGKNTYIQNGAAIDATGGFIETSADKAIKIEENVDIVSDIWLIDPINVTIANSGATPYVAATTIGNSLNHGTDITIVADGGGFASQGNITIVDDINKTMGHSASLTLEATNGVFFNKNATITSKRGKLDVTINADTDGTNGGAVYMDTGSGIFSHGGDITVSGNGNSKHNAGIDLVGATLDADGGDISLTGTGADIFGGSNFGVALEKNSVVQTAERGDIDITGTANSEFGNKTRNFGIFLDSSEINSERGSITLTGISGNGVGIAASGPADSSMIGDKGSRSHITFITDTTNIGNQVDVTTRGTVTFKPYTTTTSIGIAGAAGTLQLASSFLDNVTARDIIVGSTSDTGGITANTYDWDPPVSSPDVSFLNSGDIAINGLQTMGTGKFFAQSTNGNITLGTDGAITSTATGTPIVLDASNGNFINNNSSADALSTPNGRWLVYSLAPETDVFGNLNIDFEQFNAPYATAPAQSTGNGMLFNSSLTINISLTGTIEKTYDGTDTATVDASNFGYNSGYTGTVTYTDATYASPNVGTGISVTANGINLTGVQTTGGATVYGYTQGNTTATGDVGQIDAAKLTITANDVNMTYGDGNNFNGFTPSGLVNGETIGSVDLATNATLSGSGNWNAGNWTITASNPVADSGSKFLASNYDIKFVDGALNIDKAKLSITADAQTKVYGEVDPTLTYQQKGLISGDSITGDLTRDPGEHVADGPYAINQGTVTAGDNYTITYTGDNLTITPATLTVTADAQTKVYGQVDPALTYTTSGLQFKDTNEDVLSGGLTRDSGEHVAGGPYAINQGTLTSNSDYTISYKGDFLTITPATLSVFADNQFMIIGDPLPTLTYTFSGLQNGDTSSVFTGGLETVPANTLIGFYPITQGTLSAGSDYNIDYTEGTLTIAAPGTLFSLFDEIKAPLPKPPSQNGILLAMATGGGPLGGLAPAAGGTPPLDFSNFDPSQLANLNPSAGGNGPAGGGVVSLIECSPETPCQINQ